MFCNLKYHGPEIDQFVTLHFVRIGEDLLSQEHIPCWNGENNQERFPFSLLR